MRPGIWFSGALVVLTGCTRVVELDLAGTRPQLVVQARLEVGAPVQRIVLSTTDAFDAAGAPPPAEGALVVVTSELGQTFPFAEGIPGRYESAHIPLAIGRRYTLAIEYEGERYEATQTVVAVPPIDSLYFVFEDGGVGQGDPGFRAVIDYTDEPAVRNFYLWELFVDGERRVDLDPGNRFRIISDDEFYDGGVVTGYQPFDEEIVDPGQTVTLRQIGLPEEGYRYYFALFEQTTGGGGPFSTPPASVRGNVANLTDPGHRALGFFLASAVSERTKVVPPP